MTVLAVAQPIAVQHVVAPGALARQAMARAGESVAKFLKRHRWRFDLDTILVINGRPVLRRDDGWKTRRFAPGDVVRFVSRPFGGQQGKQIGGLIALIALTVFASWAIGPTLAGSALLATVTKAVIVAGGMMLYNTLVYPKPGNRSDEDNLYSFNAAGNTARPLETIPDAYGRLQRDLDYAAIPYKTYAGNIEYFQGLFMIGDGRYAHEALLVDDIEFWTAEAAATDGTGTGPGGTVPDGSLFWTNDEGDRPTSPGVLDPFEDIQIEFVEPGEPVTLFPTNVHQSPDVNGLEFDHPGSAGGGWSPWFPVCNPNDVTNLIHLDIALPNGFSRNTHDTFADYTVEIRPIDAAGAATGAAVSTTRRYSGLHRKPHRFTHSFPQAVAQRYALRFRRAAEPTTGDNTDFYAAGLRAEIPGETVFPEGTMVAVRIKATKQLSDYSSRRIRYRGTRILPVWTGSAWEEQPTRNPIWAAINLRSNADYGGKLPLGRFQLDEWIAAAAAADARGDCFDHEFKNAVKVGEAVDLALGAARSKHRWYGHILGLVRDEWQASPRMLVTDREMVAGSFSLTANFRDENAPDGLIVNYIDQETWRPAQVVVPIGSSPVNPVTEELRGVTSRAHATREAVFKWNAQVKRRIGPSFTMLLDGHTLNYGDHLDIQSRAPQAWGTAHAVVGLAGSTVRLPRAPQWPDGVTMYAAIRTKTGGLFGPCRVTEGATPRHLVFNATDLAALLTATGMTLADALDRAPDAAPPTLVMGEAFDFLKRMQVVSVEPRGDKAQVVGFLDAEAVHAPDEVEEAPRPPTLTYPSRNLPRVVSLDARLRQVLFETRLEASWPSAPNATRYVVEVKYDEAAVWVPVYDGPVNACDVVVDNYAMQVRVVPFGDRGAGHASPIIDLAPVTVTVPAGTVDFDALTSEVQERVEEVEAGVAQGVADLRDLAKSLSPVAATRAEVRDRFQNNLHDAVRQLGLAISYALARVDEQSSTMRDAGISVDPTTGAIRITAVDQLRTSTQTQFTKVSALFDAVNALIALRVTQADLDAAIEAVIAGFQPAYRYEFNGTAEGWTGSNATLTPDTGSLDIAGTGAGAYAQSPTLALDADINKIVGARVRRIAGSGWGLALQWGSGYGNSRAFSEPADPDEWNIIRLDQNGQTDWSGTLTGLRLAVANGSTFEFDYIEIGNSALNDLIVGDLSARISDLEIELDAANSAISVRATLAQLTAATDRITVAELAIDAANAAIAGKVSTTTFEGVETRVTTAEFEISSLKNQITFTIGEIADKGKLIRDLALSDAKGQIDAFLRNQTVSEALAYASQTLGARVDANGVAIASFGLQLLALTDSTDARFTEEALTRADAVSALASRAAALETSVNHPTTGLATRASASSVVAVQSQVDGQGTAIGSLGTRTDTLEATVYDETTGLVDRTAAVETLAAAKVTESEVNALIASALTARFGAPDDPDRIEAKVEQIFNVTAGPTGASALWSVQLDVDGRVSGLKNLNTGETSAFIIRADLFGIENPDTEELSLYYDTDTNTFVIKDGTLIAAKVTSVSGRMVSDYANEVAYWLDESDEVIVQIGDLDYEP